MRPNSAGEVRGQNSMREGSPSWKAESDTVTSPGGAGQGALRVPEGAGGKGQTQGLARTLSNTTL